MARIPIQDVDSATGSNKQVFEHLKKALGVVPNMTRVMANSPAALQAYAQFSGALAGGKLPAKVREQIAVLSAETNACEYCLAAHTVIGEKVGLDAAALEAARDASAPDAKARAALVFAQHIIDERGGISPSDIVAVRNAGYTDGEIAEIVANVALNLYTNYFNRAFDVDVDFPRVAPRPTSSVS